MCNKSKAASNKCPEYQILKFGEVKPQGWLLRQIENDLQHGIAGNYDRISSNVSQNLFAAQSRSAGTWVKGEHGVNEKSWWAGEHEAYWMDGVIRMAILCGNADYLIKAEKWVEKILRSYKKSGYIGIYSPETRYPSQGFDGELWTQSRAYQALLAWYEYSGDKRVLEAVTAAVRRTVEHYRSRNGYFGREGAEGGVFHGVGYMDTLEWLWRLTGDSYYADAAIWLYMDFCNGKDSNKDISYKNLRDAKKPWQAHTPHTAESLHLPGIAGFFSDDSEIIQASKNIYQKLERHTCPGGGFVAGHIESISGVSGNGDETSEYCSMTEAVLSLNRLLMYQGILIAGDWCERTVLNAAMGARFHPANTAVIYLTRDNRLNADRRNLNGGREIFAATHSAAACCSLNSIRLLPAYIEGMWYKSSNKPRLMANLYGASELNTRLDNKKIKIVQKTLYPFSDKVVFELETDDSMLFELALRLPPNCGEININTTNNAEVIRKEELIIIRGEWNHREKVVVDFDFKIKSVVQHDQKQAYYQWGPLVFSLPFNINKNTWKSFANSSFHAYSLSPQSDEGWNALIDAEASFKIVELSGDTENPWEKPVIGLKGTVLTMQNEKKEVVLKPLGCSLLRRTTFPLKKEFMNLTAKVNEHVFGNEEDPMLQL